MSSIHTLADRVGGYVGTEAGRPVLVVPTLKEDMVGRLGDYLVQGVAGEFYPVRRDIFEQTYELVIEP